MNINAIKVSEETKDSLLELIAKQQAEEAMTNAITSLSNAIYITALANTENPSELIKNAVEKINANTERFSSDEENEAMLRETLVELGEAITQIATNPVAKTGNGQALSDALKADNAERMAEE